MVKGEVVAPPTLLLQYLHCTGSVIKMTSLFILNIVVTLDLKHVCQILCYYSGMYTVNELVDETVLFNAPLVMHIILQVYHQIFLLQKYSIFNWNQV